MTGIKWSKIVELTGSLLVESEENRIAKNWLSDFIEGKTVSSWPEALLGITRIGNRVFYYHENVAFTELPENIVEIGDSAFEGCKNLSITALPEGITYIGSYAFADCTGINSLVIPSTLAKVGDYPFQDCLETAIFASGRLSTLEDMFEHSTVKNIVLPEGLEVIEWNSFRNCSLTSINLPNSLTTIRTAAFLGDEELVLTSLPNNINTIDSLAFDGCSKITLDSLPASLAFLGENAFRDCTSITSITFNSTPTFGFPIIFNGCTNLTTINVPWAEGEVDGAPWGATNATINYNYTGD